MPAQSLATGGPPACCAWFGGGARPATKGGSPSAALRLTRAELQTQGPAGRAASLPSQSRFPQAGPRCSVASQQPCELMCEALPLPSVTHFASPEPRPRGREAVVSPFHREENHKRLSRAMGLDLNSQSPHFWPPPCPIPAPFRVPCTP